MSIFVRASPATAPTAPRNLRRLEPRPWLVASGLFVVYTALSVRRHQRWQTSGFDLGVFMQYAASFSRGLPSRSQSVDRTWC